MRPHSSAFKISKLVIIGGFLIVAYVIYVLTVSLYKNYQIDQHIREFEAKNQEIARDNKEKAGSYKYYTSEEYIEKMAKQSLGLIKEGEEIIILQADDTISVPEIIEMAIQEEHELLGLSNPEKWWRFFFDSNPFKY